MWLAHAQRIPGNSAGAMNGDGSRKLLLHSTEGSTIEGAVGAYTKNNSWPHLTVDCRQRRVVQHLPLDVAARSLRNLSGGEETNRDGTILVQVELVGFATNPATIGTAADLEWFGREVVAPICGLTSVPATTGVAWLAYPASYGASPVRLSGSAWDGYSGVLGHMHAPENLHGDPGAIDINRILAAARGATQEEPLKLDAEDRKWIEDHLIRTASFLTTGRGNALYNPQIARTGFVDDTATTTLNEVIAAARDLPDVDEVALAAALAPLLPPQMQSLSDGDLAAIATVVNDEQHRRSAE